MGIFIYIQPPAAPPPPTPQTPVIIEDSATAPQNVVSQGIFDTSAITAGNGNFNVGQTPITGSGSIQNLIFNFISGAITGSRNIVYGLRNSILLNNIQNRIFGEGNTITGTRNNVLGDGSTIVGSTNSVVGSGIITGNQNASLGENNQTNFDRSVMLGAGVRMAFNNSLVVASLHSILKRTDVIGDTSYWLRSGTNFNFITTEIDLLTLQNIVFTLPAGSSAYVYKCYIIITDSTGFLGGGRFELGSTASPTIIFNNQSYSVGTVGQIEIFETKVGNRLTDIRLAIVSAGSATTLKGRFILEGFLTDL